MMGGRAGRARWPEPFRTFQNSRSGRVLWYQHRWPQTYGTPGDLEAIAKQAVYIVLASRLPDWTYDDTQALWREVAQTLYGAGRFRGEDELHQRYFWWRWNDREDEAWEQVARSYRKLWAQTPPDLRDAERARDPEGRCARAWIEHLLAHPRLLDNPCEYESVLHGLVGAANYTEPIDEAAWKRYQKAYDRELRRVGGDESRGFCDIGTDEEWEARGPWPRPEFTSYDRVLEGVTQVLWRVRDLVTAAPRDAS